MGMYTATVADPEICPRGLDDSRNLQRGAVAIFFTSFNRGTGDPGPEPPSLDPLLLQ